jgi:hypothetical protein
VGVTVEEGFFSPKGVLTTAAPPGLEPPVDGECIGLFMKRRTRSGSLVGELIAVRMCVEVSS